MIPRTLIRLIITAFLILTARTAAGVEYLCHKISLDEGLSHSNVTALTRDGRGFLWIGTRFGLNRYDFEGTQNFYHLPNDSTSLPGNFIIALHTDNRGRVWVATEDGMARHNPTDNTFEWITDNGQPLRSGCFIDETNGVLIGAYGGVYYYDFTTGSLNRLQTKGGSTKAYTAIHRRSPDSYIMVTRWDGIWLFDRTHATLTRIPGMDEVNVMASTIDSNGVLYYSPYGEGLRAYDRAGTPLFNFTTANSPLPSNIVLDLSEHDGRIWIATDGGGITIFDPVTGQFDADHNCHTLKSLGSVTKVYTDRHGNIYAGTVREGAVAILPTAMRTISPAREPGAVSLSVIYRDSQGRVWVGSDGHGVMLYEPASDTFTPVPSTARMKITAIAEHDANHLLLANFADGFCLLDKNTGSISNAPMALRKLRADHPNPAVPIHLRNLAPNSIAIVTDRIDTYNPLDGSVAAGFNSNLGSMVPFFSGSGRLLCHSTNFIADFDPVTGQTSKIFEVPEGRQIVSATYDGHSTIFLASDNEIMRLNITDGTFTDMLPITERVSAMECENNGRLWLASTHAIYLLNPGSTTPATFGLNDGIVPNEYLCNTVLQTDNRVLFGGIYGLLRIETREVDALMAMRPDPTINLADIRVDGRSVYANITDGELSVPYRFNSIMLSAIDDGQDSQRRSQFRFIIRGGGQERVAETNSRSVDLSFLDPGDSYEINMASLRPDGTWTRPQRLVRLAVMSPWFKSVWMWVAVIAFVISMWVVWEVRQRKLRKARIAQQLENYRHSSMEREIAFLINTNYALRTPLTLIYAPLKLALERLRRGEQDDLLPELERVYQNTKKMRDTIDMALELHQVHSKPNTGNLTTHDISRSVRDVLTAIAPDADVKHLTTAFLPTQDMFPAVYDRERLRSVLEIFVHNAIQRSSQHGSVEVRASMREGFVRVSVSDTGGPMEDDFLSELFSRYLHAEEAKFEHSIEFAYAKNIIEIHGGTVGAENNADMTGVTIWFEIPAAGQSAADAYARRRREEDVKQPVEIESIAAGVDTSAMTALVVEGDNDLCLFISSQLGEYFNRVYHSFNGKDAWLLIKQYQPDIVISSLRLPGMSGLELCQTVKSTPETSHIPVILLTALKEGSTLENAYEAGADSYLSKPFDLNILMARCRNILHTRSVIRKRYAELPAKNEPNSHAVTNADETFILKVNKIINDNLSNPEFGVSDLVDRMATSRSALYSKFKELTGQTLGAYIADMRLRKAKKLLTETEYSVNEISDMLGFNSQRYFSTFFKERTGQTPSAYRTTPQA